MVTQRAVVVATAFSLTMPLCQSSKETPEAREGTKSKGTNFCRIKLIPRCEESFRILFPVFKDGPFSSTSILVFDSNENTTPLCSGWPMPDLNRLRFLPSSSLEEESLFAPLKLPFKKVTNCVGMAHWAVNLGGGAQVQTGFLVIAFCLKTLCTFSKIHSKMNVAIDSNKSLMPNVNFSPEVEVKLQGIRQCWRST